MLSGTIIVSLLVTLYAIRKYRESLWGKCKNTETMEGKVIVVTGANSGLGKETAYELAKRHGKVIMACRDVNAATQAVKEIRKKTNNGELVPMQLDLASLESVEEFAKETLKTFPHIHILVNNAGVYVPEEQRRKTKDGFEIHFGINHLGHFHLTNLLLERIKVSAPARIVVVTSSKHQNGKIDFDNLNAEKGWDETQRSPLYNNSKLANVMFASHLSKLLEGSGVNVYSICPGFVYTNLSRNVTMKWFHYALLFPVAFIFMRSVSQGVQTTLHCCTSENVKNESGKFYRDCKVVESKAKFTQEDSERLWNVSAQIVRLKK